jgi:hypothetical protein
MTDEQQQEIYDCWEKLYYAVRDAMRDMPEHVLTHFSQHPEAGPFLAGAAYDAIEHNSECCVFHRTGGDKSLSCGGDSTNTQSQSKGLTT